MTDAHFEWNEELPENCPLVEAYIPDNEIYYRVVIDFPPTEENFYSQRKKFPEKLYKVSECIARACSVYSTYEACDNNTRKAFPYFKSKPIVKIVLTADSGMICQTTNDPNHYSWWMAKEFDPSPYCQVIEK